MLIHQPCNDCGSSDGMTIYDDHTYCFVCQKWRALNDVNNNYNGKGKTPMGGDLLTNITYKDLKARGIREDTCTKYGYGVSQALQVAPYYDDDGTLLFQKTRDKDKNFRVRGTKDYRFFGQHLFKTGGLKLIITEGEIDCLTVSQVQENKYPVVSLPFGAGSAVKTFKAQYEWLNKFDEVIVMFDEDKAGREAVDSIGCLLPPNKLKVAELPLKDANDVLLKGNPADIVKAVWNAKPYRPDGIYNAMDLKDVLFAQDEQIQSFNYPDFAPDLTRMTSGIRKGEMVLLTAGTGIGKSTFARELAYDLKMNKGLRIGMVMLEESPKKTLRDLLSIHMCMPLHLKWNDKELVEDIRERTYAEVFSDGNFIVYDHFGSIEADNLLDKIRYLVNVEKCDFVVLDHISIAVSGLEGNDERKTIDRLMTHLRSLVEQSGAGLILISHLRKTESSGVPFEQGGKISLDDLRGSGSLKQLPDTIISLERNQQAEDNDRNNLKIRVLKNRFSGDTGLADTIRFNKKYNRLELIDELDVKGEDNECQF